MAQKNDTTALIVALLLTLGIVGTGVWWLMSRGGLQLGAIPSGGLPGLSQGAERLSTGKKSLFAGDISPQKQAGMTALVQKNYAEAVTQLNAALAQQRNDPETLIYLNNARIGDQKTVAIAVSVPASTTPSVAQEILRGVAQAQSEVNEAGGVNGTLLKVMIASDDNSPQVTPEIAKALVQDQEILAVIGHFGSDATLAAAPIYQQGQLVMISPTSTSVQLSGLGNYIFRTAPSDRFTGTILARYLLQTLKQQKAAIFYNGKSQYSRSLKEEFTTALISDGGQVVGEFDFQAENQSFSAGDSFRQAQQQGMQVVVLFPNTETLDQALQVVAVNRQQLPILAGDSAYTAKTLEIGGQNAVGMVLGVAWNLLSHQNTPFPQKALQLWGGEVNWRTAMTYDATMAIVAALKQNPTRTGIQQALSNPNFTALGAAGEIRFQPSGDRARTVELVKIQPGNRTRYGYEFVPLKD